MAAAGFKSEHACACAGPCGCQVSIPTTGACYCTGACRRTGICPHQPVYYPRPCGHVFPWYGVIPPNWCPICGAYIGPYVAPPPRCPQPYTITFYSTSTAEGTKTDESP